MKKIIWFVFVANIAISCLNEPNCYQLDNGEILINFDVLAFAADQDSLLDIRTSGTDSIFYPNEAVSQVKLPLNPNTKGQTYIFRWKNGSSDTLSLGYSSQVRYVSEDCGQGYRFNNLYLQSASSFDSVRILNPTPSQPVSVNIVIYRCANPDLAGVKFKTHKGTAAVDSALVVNKLTTDYGQQVETSGSVSSFFLPLNKASSTTTFEFELVGGTTESLSLIYSRQTIASPVSDCDSVTFFSKIKIAATSFDTTSTKLIRTNTTGTATTNTKDPAIINFEIYL